MEEVFTAPNKKNTKLLALVLILLIIAVIGGLYSHSHGKKAPSASSLGSEWTEYTNKQYGLKMAYMKKWGEPKTTAQSTPSQSSLPDAPKIESHSGTRYTISFPSLEASSPLNIILTSSDYSVKTCLNSNQCSTDSTYTRADVQKVLSSNDKNTTTNLLIKGTDSYATLNYSNRSGVMALNRVVNLPKIKVSAARLVFVMPNASSECKNNQLPTNPSGNCLTSIEYNNLNSLAKSLQSL